MAFLPRALVGVVVTLATFLVLEAPIRSLAADAGQLTSEGQRAYLRGDIETAKAKFQEALRLDPKNVAARNFLGTIRVQEARAGTGGGNPLERQLKSLILPQVTFRQATFSSALEYLKQQADSQSVAVSFVSHLPAEKQNAPVTLNLNNVPFTEALRYLCDLIGARFVVDRYAVVIREAALTGTGTPAGNSPSPGAGQAQ